MDAHSFLLSQSSVRLEATGFINLCLSQTSLNISSSSYYAVQCSVSTSIWGPLKVPMFVVVIMLHHSFRYYVGEFQNVPWIAFIMRNILKMPLKQS